MTKPKDLTDPSSERGLIGAILLDPAVLDLPEVAGIGRDAFYVQFYSEAFELARELYRGGAVPDLVLLSADLEAHGASDAFGKLAHLIDDWPEVWNAGEYARRVQDLADRRAAQAESSGRRVPSTTATAIGGSTSPGPG